MFSLLEKLGSVSHLPKIKLNQKQTENGSFRQDPGRTSACFFPSLNFMVNSNPQA